MRIALIGIICFCILGCQQDTNKSKSKIKAKKENNSIVKKTPEEEVVIPSAGDADIDLSKVKTITQEELMPFLRDYFKKNNQRLFVIETRFGNIKIKLYNDTPLHTANFARLVELDYFNTTFFHRVSKNFVIQGGNSDKIVTHKFRNKIGDFLIPNEYMPRHKHAYGVVSAAKFTEQNVSNASSPFEFFIVTAKNGAPHLDKKHTVFGEVVSGMDVVHEISKVEVDDSEWPRQNIGIDIKPAN